MGKGKGRIVMDFGDILNQWSDQQKSEKQKKKQPQNQVSHKKANAPTAEEKAAMTQGYSAEAVMEADARRKINPMEMWLRRYGTVDKDKIADQYAEENKMQSREYLRTMRPEARIDLHGLTRDEAWSRLESFVLDCKRRGLKKILIVHGKGNHSHGSDPVLGAMVRTYIERSEHLGTSGHPDHTQGGTGATWVIIK